MSTTKKRARGPARPPHRNDLSEKVIEALTVAMVVAPGVYARNRMFDLFVSRGAKRARARASIVRGIIPQLARATSVTLESESLAGKETAFVLRYQISAVRLTRVVELSAAELAALRLMAARANVHCLPPSDEDNALVARALAWLLDAEGISRDVSRAKDERDVVQDVSLLAREISSSNGEESPSALRKSVAPPAE